MKLFPKRDYDKLYDEIYEYYLENFADYDYDYDRESYTLDNGSEIEKMALKEFKNRYGFDYRDLN